MFGLPKYGSGIGFHRLLRFCDDHNMDLRRFSEISLVVTGSNGKGSTAKLISAALQTRFSRVGCFTSPHLLAVNERFEVNEEVIPSVLLDSYIDIIRGYDQSLRSQDDYLGAFELLFLVALLWFEHSNVDCLVMEAGIGGRYDPVRILNSATSVLTSVDLEHTELLGHTKELIAFDKIDATGAGGVTLVSPSVDVDLYARLHAYARVASKELQLVRDAALRNIQWGVTGTQYSMRWPSRRHRAKIEIPLIGKHQAYNSATALHAAAAYCARREMPLDPESAIEALSTVKWPGRLEKIHDRPEIWIDVGHTPEAIESVAQTIKEMFGTTQPIIVLGISANKAVQRIASIVERHFSTVILTRAYKGGEDIDNIAAQFSDPTKIWHSAGTIEEATMRAVELAERTERPVVVLGGLFVAVEFAFALGGGDPKSLHFF